MYSALIGNGVSLAYNPSLRVANLTADLVSDFEDLGASEAGEALRSLARAARRDPANGFESMLGPLEATARALEALVDLTPISADTSAAEPVRRAREFVEEVHRVGLAVVLGRIARYSSGVGGARFEGIEAFGDAMKELAGPGRLTVGTLNYDGLTHAGLLANRGAVSDLADGRVGATLEVVPGGLVAGHRLRVIDDFPEGTTPLIQLHGSLGWLREPGSRRIWRFALEELRNVGYWDCLQDGETGWTPAVVLTDQKERTIARRPFAMAYDSFQRRLIASDRWLVAGYGLGDNPVNELFRSAAETRSRLGLPGPRLLIVDYGKDEEELLTEVATIFGVTSTDILVTTVGVPDAVFSPEWAAWAA